MHPMLNIAIRAARAAGDLIVRHIDRLDTLSVTSKNLNDFVSEVDRQAEDAIIRTLRKAYPHHSILADSQLVLEMVREQRHSGKQGVDKFHQRNPLWKVDGGTRCAGSPET